jgi:hypothetical protein
MRSVQGLKILGMTPDRRFFQSLLENSEPKAEISLVNLKIVIEPGQAQD